MRDWELVLYKYANFSSLQSECPDSSGPYRPAPAGALPVRVRYRRATPTFAFFSLSLDPFFFFRYTTRSASIFRFITSLCQNGALSLYFTIIERTLSGSNISMHIVQVSERNARLLPLCSVVLKSLKFSPLVVHIA